MGDRDGEGLGHDPELSPHGHASSYVEDLVCCATVPPTNNYFNIQCALCIFLALLVFANHSQPLSLSLPPQFRLH